MYWSTHVARLTTTLRETAAQDGRGDVSGSEALAEVIDVVTDLVDLLLPHSDDTIRNLGAAAMHLSFAREHAAPVGPSAVPGTLPLPIAFRDARALLAAALEVLSMRDAVGERDGAAVRTRSRTRNHLRAAARALGREVVLPAQRGPRGARTV
jgi:hypothetical protein